MEGWTCPWCTASVAPWWGRSTPHPACTGLGTPEGFRGAPAGAELTLGSILKTIDGMRQDSLSRKGWGAA